ncbi:hypothetical protein B0T10DRAFT_498162 [Thelonectria olida]|uniref:Uncharacterized protein n=1 Tax=Thelonectria olida TaxID=1576542 RepID=A0A9P9ALP7_9HYPO|nr:hypothetical protein B0T10DRAFT_498162 [Thelonectria olida]
MAPFYDLTGTRSHSARLRYRYGSDIDPHYAIIPFGKDISDLQQEANIDLIVHKNTFKNGNRINHAFTPPVFKLIDMVVEGAVPYISQWAERGHLWVPNMWNPYVVPEVCRLEGPCSLWPDRNYTTVLVSLSSAVTRVEILHRGRKNGETVDWHPNSIMIVTNVGVKMSGLGNIKVVCITYMVDRKTRMQPQASAAGITFAPSPVQPYAPSGGVYNSPGGEVYDRPYEAAQGGGQPQPPYGGQYGYAM